MALHDWGRDGLRDKAGEQGQQGEQKAGHLYG